MNYTPCPTMDGYVILELQFAGDADLVDEIKAHKAACPLCQGNIKAFEDRERERVINANQSIPA